MPKLYGGYTRDSSPTTDDKIPTLDVTSGGNRWALISDLITLFFNNIPTGAHSDVTRGSETFYDFVAGNTGVWTADSAGVNRNASMTALTVYVNGRRIAITAVTARTFTASKDTYVDVLDNTDGTGTLVYTEVSNNAASPALAANSLRLAIIITGATTIAASTSINQGQEARILPIASSIAYSVSDSLGNLICPRDPQRLTLSYRQITGNLTTTSGLTLATGLTANVIAPLGRKLEVEGQSGLSSSSTGGAYTALFPYDGTIGGGGTQLAEWRSSSDPANNLYGQRPAAMTTPAVASKTYNMGFGTNGGTFTLTATSTNPAFIRVKLA